MEILIKRPGEKDFHYTDRQFKLAWFMVWLFGFIVGALIF